MWFIGRDECTPPKKNPGSAPDRRACSQAKSILALLSQMAANFVRFVFKNG